MHIANDCVVSFHYTLTNNAGEVLDSSRGKEPLVYLHGAGSIVPGLENMMAGKSVGDRFVAVVPPEQGYGLRIPALLQTADRSMFPPDIEPEVGMQFQAESNMGPVLVKVVSVEGNTITLDGNHELADVTLNFDVEVTAIRAATLEETQHGHVHGAGGHHH